LPNCFINGFNTTPIQVHLPKQQIFFGVLFQPLAIKKIFGSPASEFSDITVDLTLLDPNFNSLWHGLLLVNMYTSLIDAKSWGSDIPNSVAAAREYYKTVNPGNFFRIFSPVNQALGLLVLILFRKTSPSIRLFAAVAFAMHILAEGLTFQYFYPRNDIMFRTARLSDTDLLRKTWSEWNITQHYFYYSFLRLFSLCTCRLSQIAFILAQIPLM
jgi:hypothetical protein